MSFFFTKHRALHGWSLYNNWLLFLPFFLFFSFFAESFNFFSWSYSNNVVLLGLKYYRIKPLTMDFYFLFFFFDGVINGGFDTLQDCVFGSVQVLGPRGWGVESSIMGPRARFQVGPSIPRKEFRQREALDCTIWQLALSILEGIVYL